VLNVMTPYMPIMSDGKEPDLSPFLDEIKNAVAKAVRRARRPDAKGKGTSQKDIVLDNLDGVIAAVSGEEGYRFNERQLFYALRPIVMNETGKELKIGNFKDIITDYENENGEISLMYREPRGSITHPHRNETFTLGTLMVEEYERPAWNFNKLVYIEKEGAQEALKQNRWCERHDCAVMSSKGFSTQAARDLIDKLVEHDEPVEVFCVHDADASGTMIYQTLQQETKARGARRIKIINLGLEPWEAVAMGLEVETVEKTERLKPVADYIREREDGDYWENWLQTNRIELNAMTTPQLIGWLDEKLATFGSGKLIPPQRVLEQHLADRIESKVRAAITDRVLREAKIGDQGRRRHRSVARRSAVPGKQPKLI
jgi:Topoisomerase 6 subunit A/Spo11, Toprim domain